MTPQLQDRPRTRTRPAPTLVLGLGNILLRDEGIGVRVVEALQALGLPAGVDAFDGGTAGFELIDILADRDRVIVIDAIDTDDPPGTVVRLTPADLEPTAPQPVSVHEIGFLDALEGARRLGVAPREVVILGVRPSEVHWGLTLSPVLARLVTQLVALVQTELAGMDPPPEST